MDPGLLPCGREGFQTVNTTRCENFVLVRHRVSSLSLTRFDPFGLENGRGLGSREKGGQRLGGLGIP